LAGAAAGKVTAVVFDVGETLVDEPRAWERIADVYGVPRFTLMALVGAAIERGESHRQAFEWLGIDGPYGGFSSDAVHVRLGPWGVLHDASAADARIDSLDELAEAFG
jgi:hypothetical protein